MPSERLQKVSRANKIIPWEERFCHQYGILLQNNATSVDLVACARICA